MKACVLEGPAKIETNPLKFMDVPKPKPGRGEVLVRVKACGVCRTDLHVIEGELAPKKSPVIPGHQVVGIVEELGEGAGRFAKGARVGVAWLHKTDGTCGYCRSGQENLCDEPTFTGYTVDGGYADLVVAAEDFVYAIPEEFPDEQAAPLLCAGIIGFRCLRLAGVQSGAKLGFYGFGAAAHVAIQVARHWGGNGVCVDAGCAASEAGAGVGSGVGRRDVRCAAGKVGRGDCAGSGGRNCAGGAGGDEERRRGGVGRDSYERDSVVGVRLAVPGADDS